MAEYKQVLKVLYRIITPIHIGMGADISPFEYVIKDGNFYRIESDDLISGLSEEQLKRFYSYIESNNLIGLRNVILENFNESYAKYKISVTRSVVEKYDKSINDVRNQLLISPFIRSVSDFRPYLPGSSIKGAIRTAIINDAVQNEIKKIGRHKLKEFQKKLFDKKGHWELELVGAIVKTRGGERSDAKRDPFRVLKVSDVYLSDEFFHVGEVLNASVNERRGRVETVGIQMFKEVLLGEVNLSKPVEFEGEIRIDEILSEAKYKGIETEDRIEKWIPMALSKDYIIKTCNDFYLNEFKREREFFEFAVDMHDVLDKIGKILSPSKDEFVIRVGRFSGVTAVTVNEIRKPHNKKWGNTKNLFEGKFPMGWVKVKFLS
ncbi:CRISPR type III-A/MTUBE-associated RAMP protein Csm5 [Candidatus Thermokryptus mobilis]|uniref:CRISPR system Cms protein Csm5 n=1 Tax=Candidatus Thermokryptus mobilis TaxID=1643428 RepID=A0A0S4NEG2_9BACT|nr:type III-A CRISPR-associated RAMP protein Csm5 [Candidatus Thermokryptus mobilis]CUU09193.1 CRISPR type III-A/MTUBE-associated RAMP protein Csm5 [Candidatus Thermokryptus mobilis]